MWKMGNSSALLMGMEITVIIVKSNMKFPPQFQIELPYTSAIPLLDFYPKAVKSICQREICTPKFIAALLTIAGKWK